jgi:transglutaminase-like putative cysteine protease
MQIKVGYDISYEVWAPTAMVLMLHIHPSRAADIRVPEQLRIEPGVPMEEFTDSFGNRCVRIVAPPGEVRLTCEAVVEDSGLPDPICEGAEQHPTEQLPVETLPFLLGSRYCETDKLAETAWRLFGHIPTGWARVQAVCDWVHQNVTFGYHFARSDKSALEVFHEKQGVCRDFTHLAVTLCRCLNIPTRYVTGYLGDIGVPPVPFPMDFSAWFEVYLGGQWHTFDARHNRRRIGRIVMARGRDATDVALTTTFGRHALRNFQVWTDELPAAAIERAA